jgi:hypothetical protein
MVFTKFSLITLHQHFIVIGCVLAFNEKKFSFIGTTSLSACEPPYTWSPPVMFLYLLNITCKKPCCVLLTVLPVFVYTCCYRCMERNGALPR